MNKGIFFVFLAMAAAQDLKKKRIDLWIYLVFGAAAAAALITGGIVRAADPENMWRYFCDRAAGALPGLGLLGIGASGKGEIGAGDGLFFLISGLLLGFWNNVALLCYGVFCCGVFCLGYFVWKRVRTGDCAGRDTVPFLPFAVIPGIWLCLRMPGGG